MQIERLKIFCEVVRWTSFSRGAAECGVSQSSASHAVHYLEERLGLKLIDRSTRPFILTPQGQVYFEGCKDLIARYEGLENQVKVLEGDSNVVGTVYVSSIYSVGLHHMNRYIERFQRLFPSADVKLDYLHPTDVLEGVQNGSVELGLISFPRKWPDLTVLPWRNEEMVLAVHPAHPLASQEDIEPEALDGEPLVRFDSDLAIRRAIDRFLRKYGVQTRAALEFDNIENIKRAVE
ncbi:MAG: LysR family transcriptional regulator, partial [Isosphaeraceae bacterium]